MRAKCKLVVHLVSENIFLTRHYEVKAVPIVIIGAEVKIREEGQTFHSSATPSQPSAPAVVQLESGLEYEGLSTLQWQALYLLPW